MWNFLNVFKPKPAPVVEPETPKPLTRLQKAAIIIQATEFDDATNPNKKCTERAYMHGVKEDSITLYNAKGRWLAEVVQRRGSDFVKRSYREFFFTDLQLEETPTGYNIFRNVYPATPVPDASVETTEPK